MNMHQAAGQLDWDDTFEARQWGNGSLVLLLITSGLYWTLLWLASGLPPLASIASRLQSRAGSR